MISFVIIGITDNPQPWFPPEVLEVIKQGKLFSGGRRHHEIVAGLLPEGAQWIDITVPLDNVFTQYKSQISTLNPQISPHKSQPSNLNPQTIVVFASGDPLFFGFANTLRREFPTAAMRVYPAFNSLQTLAHRLLMPYHAMRIVSLTGRPWQELDRALIERAPLIGILTDREKTPAAIARRCREYGFDAYRVFVGERLGNPELERISVLSLSEAAEQEFTLPNCLILSLEADESQKHGLWTSIDHISRPFGLPDSSFAFLDGREKMITKMPIRLLTLQTLELSRASVFWDVGACTGSVSIEARLLFPHLRVVAFEIRPECEAIICENCRRHAAPGIELVMGDFLQATVPVGSPTGTPDAVFIGGHGGRLKEIMAKVLTVLAPDGVIVMNSVIAPKVTTDSHQLWDEACSELGLRQDEPLHIQLNDNHPITILKCKR